MTVVMSLKPNTTRLLIFLSCDRWIRTDKQILELLLPDLSPAGRRSLISYCQKNSWVQSNLINGKRHLYLTAHGRRELELHFPLFSEKADQWNGEWYLVVFLTAPKLDPQFRYLRNYLLDKRATALTRGNYLLPSFLAVDLVEEIHRSYRTQVMMVSIKKWIFGDERSFALDNYSLLDVHQSYSGVSNELEQLLSKKIIFSSASDQEKKDIFSVFDRLATLISGDVGLLQHYFPDIARGRELLDSFFKLI